MQIKRLIALSQYRGFSSGEIYDNGNVYVSERVASLQKRRSFKTKSLDIDEIVSLDVTKETLLEQEKVQSSLSKL